MNSNFNLYLYKQRASNSAEHALARFVGQFGHLCLTVGLLWSLVSHAALIIWFVIALGVSVCTFFLQKALAPHKPLYSSNRWMFANIGDCFSIGFIWSLAPALLFVPDNTFFIVFMIALYAGYLSGSLGVNFSYKFSFIGFSIGVTLPFILRLLYEGGSLYNTIAGLMVFYVAMLMYVSHNMHKQFIKSVQAQYENELLIEELADEKAIVEKAVTAKDKFLAAASHDLRQPLNAINLFTDALKPLQSSSKGSEILIKVKQSLRGLNGMLHGLLDISRLDAEAVDNNPKHVLLKTIIDQLHEEYRHNAKNLTIITDLSAETIVFVDPTNLYRILNNLLDNAVKYTKQGGIVISALEDSAGIVRLTIKDTGVGIPKDKISIVFDEFRQLNNPERDREKGLGLGLSIVKRLCRISGVELNIESQVDQGTIVTLELCLGTTQVDNEIVYTQHTSSLKDKYIVVIDDEKDILDGMHYLLSSYGCDVITADSLATALVKLKQRSNVPNLIISDLRLRNNSTGIEAIETIQDEYNADIPAVLITGDTAPDKIIEAKSQDYATMYKPIEPDELKQTISKLLAT